MVRLTAAALASALFLAAADALPSPVVFSTNSSDSLAGQQLEARYQVLPDISQLDRRYTSTFTPPSGYRFSWGIDGSRVSYGTSSGEYITRSTISGASAVGQSEVTTCGARCEATNGCGFFHPVQMSGGSEGSVICALYKVKQSKSAATYTTGAGSSGGTVRFSYGFTRDAGPSSGTASASGSASGSGSSSGTGSSSGSGSGSTTGSNGLPTPPSGATLIQYKGCSSSSATVPMFVNKNYPISGSTSASTVWIVQHGSGRNFNDYFSSIRNVVGDAGVIIAPNFYATSDSGEWFQPAKNLAWRSNDWFNGDDAIAPSGVSSCSSFDVYDSILALVRDRSKFPNVSRVFIVAHSGGASMMAKYGMLRPNTGARYVLANSPSMPYFTTARPNAPTGCSNYNSFGYGWAGPLNRYVSARTPGGQQAFRNWITQDITLMTADLDTYSRDASGDQSCPVQAQGGQNRRDRGYAFWAYINLLGGTSTDVSQYYGYDSLKQQGVSSLGASRFGARHCVVDNVGHDNYAMFASDCGRAAINGASSIPAGPGPVRP